MGQCKNIFKTIQPTSVSAKILISLGEVGDLSRVCVNKRVIQKGQERLIKKGLIQFINQRKIKLSEAGLIEFFKLELTQTDLLSKNKICLVVFDVPEISKEVRNLLRKFLKDSCFFPFQKSVWVSQFDMAKPLSKIFHLTKLDKWVRVFTATEVKMKPRHKTNDRSHRRTKL